MGQEGNGKVHVTYCKYIRCRLDMLFVMIYRGDIASAVEISEDIHRTVQYLEQCLSEQGKEQTDGIE